VGSVRFGLVWFFFFCGWFVFKKKKKKKIFHQVPKKKKKNFHQVPKKKKKSPNHHKIIIPSRRSHQIHPFSSINIYLKTYRIPPKKQKNKKQPKKSILKNQKNQFFSECPQGANEPKVMQILKKTKRKKRATLLSLF